MTRAEQDAFWRAAAEAKKSIDKWPQWKKDACAAQSMVSERPYRVDTTPKTCSTSTMKFKDIPRFARSAAYRINVGWPQIERTLEHFMEPECPLDLNPDFQRGHVWTKAQQSAYIEYALAGGQSGKDIYFNCRGWQSDYQGPFVIVDGLQRLTAVRGFMSDLVPAYGHLYSQFEDRIRWIDVDFIFHVNNLRSRTEVLSWYLQMNIGGTPHSKKEIARVQALLAAEKKA